MVLGFHADRFLLGQSKPGALEFCLPGGVLVGLLALGFCVFLMIKRWRQETIEASMLSPQDQLDHFRKMVDEGLLDPEEFARIKAEMDKRASAIIPDPNESSPPPDQPKEPV